MPLNHFTTNGVAISPRINGMLIAHAKVLK